MRLRHIEIFQAVMLHGSISAAAQAMFISQPAATKLLQSAERSLGIALFERSARKMVPTPEALRLFAETEKLTQGLNHIVRVADSLRAQVPDTLAVIATATLALNFAPILFSLLRKQFPALRLHLASNQSGGIVDSLLLKTFQVGLTLNNPGHPSILARVIASGPLSVIAPAGTWTDEECAQPLAVHALPANLIGLDEHAPIGARIASVLALYGVEPSYLTMVHSTHMARALVEAGGGVAIVDPFTAATTHAAIQRRVLAPLIPIELFLLTASDSPSPFGTEALFNLFAQAAASCLAQR